MINRWIDRHLNALVIMLVMGFPFVGAFVAMATDHQTVPLCEEEQTLDCADYHGKGITINGTRYFACDLIDSKPCFTYRYDEATDTLWYTIQN